MTTSVSHSAPSAHPLGEVVGADRLRSRTHAELADAMTWLAWYAPGTFTAVMDYMAYCDGELARRASQLPAKRRPPRPARHVGAGGLRLNRSPVDRTAGLE